MVKILREPKQLSHVSTLTLLEGKIRERDDLQEFIWNSPEAFCRELGQGQDLLIVGKEVRPSLVVGDSIDLLGIDANGSTVIIELKRGNDKLQLFQAISYAGMVSGASMEDVLRYPGIDQTRAGKVSNFLEAGTDEEEGPNHDQRIILVAEAFDFEVLVGAQWLLEKFEVNIACVRVSMARDEASGAEYLTFIQVFPTPEIDEIAKKRRAAKRLSATVPVSVSWDEALANVNNQAVVEFFTRHLASNTDRNLKYQVLRFLVGGSRRFEVNPKRNYGKCHQIGRFEGDVEYWRGKISDPGSISIGKKVRTGDRLRFHLVTQGDFDNFESARADGSLDVEWENQGEDSLGKNEEQPEIITMETVSPPAEGVGSHK